MQLSYLLKQVKSKLLKSERICAPVVIQAVVNILKVKGLADLGDQGLKGNESQCHLESINYFILIMFKGYLGVNRLSRAIKSATTTQHLNTVILRKFSLGISRLAMYVLLCEFRSDRCI